MTALYAPIVFSHWTYGPDDWRWAIDAEYADAWWESRPVSLSDVADDLHRLRKIPKQHAQNIALIFAARLRKSGRNWLTGERLP